MEDVSRVVNCQPPHYCIGEQAIVAAGGIEGIKKLVTAFYHNMDTLIEAEPMREIQKGDRGTYIDNLINLFFVWIGGRKSIIQQGYEHMTVFYVAITREQKTAWLFCLQQALDEQDYEELYKRFVMVQLSIYAEMCCQ